MISYVLAVVVGGVAAQWLGWRFGIPAIIMLLATGLLAGPVFGLLHPSEDLGEIFEPMVGLAVAIVVFEGGLNLNIRELRSAGAGVGRLVLLGLPLNWLLGSVAAHWVGQLSWPVSMLFGAILVVTGPTVILPLLRQVRLQKRPATLLKWEAVVNDPIGAVLTILLLQYLIIDATVLEGTEVAPALLIRLATASVASAGLAILAALLVRFAFHHDHVPEVLKTPVLLAGALGLYAIGNFLFDEAGLLAATVFGIALANLGISGLRALSRYKEALTVLLVSALFILLASDLEREAIARASWAMLALVVVVLFVVRPVATLLATTGSDLGWRERLLVAWIGPRGIVAAAISGIAASRLSASGYEDAPLLLPMVFAVIVATVVAHGLTLGPLAHLFRLRATERPGILIVGSSPWTVELSKCLAKLHVPVFLVDRSWAALRQAREAGVRVLAVEVLSEWVDEAMDAGAVDYVLAATDDDAYNALVCARFAPELGRERVNQLALHSGHISRIRVPSREWRGKIVGENDMDHRNVNDRLAEGWTFTVRRVEKDGRDVSEQGQEPDERPLLVVRTDGRITFGSPERTTSVDEGDCLIAFVPPDRQSQRTHLRQGGAGGGA